MEIVSLVLRYCVELLLLLTLHALLRMSLCFPCRFYLLRCSRKSSSSLFLFLTFRKVYFISVLVTFGFVFSSLHININMLNIGYFNISKKNL